MRERNFFVNKYNILKGRKMPIISFIVPVFNTEKYIEKCLNSIVNQTKKEEIEIIIINDGSTDNSDSVIKRYIEKHKNNEKIKFLYLKIKVIFA